MDAAALPSASHLNGVRALQPRGQRLLSDGGRDRRGDVHLLGL